MHTISPIFYPLNKTQTHYSWLNCFFLNKIIHIPTPESTACLILTSFQPTSLIWSISELPPQLPITYVTTCSWVVVSNQKIFEKKNIYFWRSTGILSFSQPLFEITQPILNYANMFGIYYLSTLFWFITIHNWNTCLVLLYLSC